MPNPAISCVVPTLNSAATLDTTLLSLRMQKDVDVQILVVDSGSTDSTLEICQRWNVPSIYETPGNMYQAINTGLRQCTTEWVTYLNSDDWVYTDSYARLLAQAQKSKADLVYGHHDFVDGQGRFMCSLSAARPQHILPLFRAGELGFIQPAAIYRRDLYGRLYGFDETYALCADGDFFIRAALSGASFARLNGAPVVAFRMHQQQQTQRKWAALSKEKQQIAAALVRPPSRRDTAIKAWWRVRNIPHYSIRLLRLSTLARRLRFSIFA
ncbi:MAG: glycosyltransferase [Herpetosiphonaceae bacterium]|nr:glycosyltransferase [Herpetosiphonaceae bacterium]